MAKSLVSFSADVTKALSVIEKSAKQASKGLAQSTLHAAAIIRKNMVDSMPQGRAGQAKEVAPGRFVRDRERSKPGQPPYKQSGRTARSLKYAAEGKSARIFSEYQGRGIKKENGYIARFLEDGTSWEVYNKKKGTMTQVTMLPRPFVKPAIDKSLSRIPILMARDIGVNIV